MLSRNEPTSVDKLANFAEIVLYQPPGGEGWGAKSQAAGAQGTFVSFIINKSQRGSQEHHRGDGSHTCNHMLVTNLLRFLQSL